MGRQINLTGLGPVFRGSDAVRAGALRQGQLRGSAVRRLFQGVYSQASVAQTHELYCTAAGLALPPSAVITGRSAATLRGVALARPHDPVEALVPLEARGVRGSGLAVRRTTVYRDDWVSWSGLRLATPQRMALDLLLGRPLPDAVADLDAALRGRLVTLSEVRSMVEQRSDRGIVLARRAVQLADPRAESRPESRVRVWLVLDGLHPQPQHWIEDSRGRLARVDLAFIAQRVAVEYDGGWRDGELWALNQDRERPEPGASGRMGDRIRDRCAAPRSRTHGGDRQGRPSPPHLSLPHRPAPTVYWSLSSISGARWPSIGTYWR